MLIDHSYCGTIKTMGQNIVEATVTAYAIDEWETPIFFAFQGTREIADAIRTSFSTGRAFWFDWRTYKPPKKMYKAVAMSKLARVEQTSMTVAHVALNGNMIDDRLYILRGNLDIDERDEVFNRIAHLLPFPVFEPWRSYLWGVAKEAKLIKTLPKQRGVTVFQVTISDQWKTIIEAAIKDGLVMPLAEIKYQMEERNVSS
jgi:hypothetical protein